MRLIDARWFLPASDRCGADAYRDGHIPGAVFFDIDMVVDPSLNLPHMLPSATDFATHMEKLGIGRNHHIIIYDDIGAFGACRLWWMLRIFGHDDCAVLNGGISAWVRDGHSLTTKAPTITKASFGKNPPKKTTRRADNTPYPAIDYDSLRALIGDPHLRILDARSPSRFDGREAEPRPGLRSGHIPGSENLHYARLLDSQGYFLSAEKLRSLCLPAGIDHDRPQPDPPYNPPYNSKNHPVVTTCGSGLSACNLAFALHLIGHTNVRVYDGSWAEWGGRSDAPIACAAKDRAPPENPDKTRPHRESRPHEPDPSPHALGKPDPQHALGNPDPSQHIPAAHPSITDIIESGRPDPDGKTRRRFVNTPAYRGSTVLFDDCAEMARAVADPFSGLIYGRIGTPTSAAIETAMARLYQSSHAIATSSGLAAITCALLAFAKNNTRILVSDGVYQPTRHFCDHVLARLGVTIVYFDPCDVDDALSKITDKTRIIFLESPSSLTFEMLDIAAIADRAKKAGAVTILDNTWAGGWYGPMFKYGIDVIIEAGTKYVVGHADASIGFILCRSRHYQTLKKSCVALGNAPGGEDCALALRGLKTLPLRLARHQENALKLAHWLERHSAVAHVLHPALPSHPGHHHWKRFYRGASGLFAIVLHDTKITRRAKNIEAMIDSLRHFSIGYSWGSHESLILPANPAQHRLFIDADAPWRHGPLLRLHAGLEDCADLIGDLDRGLRMLLDQKTDTGP